MSDIVMITGTGRSYALGYNLALRYLEAGDVVIASVRKPSSDIDELKKKYGNRLIGVTMNLYNTFKDGRKVNIFAVHPGWIRTDGKDDNPAPLSSYEAAGILKNLFEERREDFEGHRFITNEGEDYPF